GRVDGIADHVPGRAGAVRRIDGYAPRQGGGWPVQLLAHEVAQAAGRLAEQERRREDVEPAGEGHGVATGVPPDAQRSADDGAGYADAAVPDLRDQPGVLRVGRAPLVDDVVQARSDYAGHDCNHEHRPALVRVLAATACLEGSEHSPRQHGRGDDDPVPVDLYRPEADGDG